MSNFTVSARKYRPGTFDTVVGQEHVTQTLKNAIKTNRLGHAFLFCGPRGVGKTTCARILAKTLNCTSLTEDGEPCGTCDACQTFAKQTSFNIYELDAASNNSVEDIRNLTEQVRFAPQSGKYKIYIIDEVHMLSQAAFNAFLKTLEEPPSYAIFILATTERHKILPTILSRCQVFDFHRIGISQAMVHLKDICVKEGIEAEDEALYVIAQKADGALRDALSIFDRVTGFSGNKITYQDVISNLNVLDYEYYFKVVNHALAKDLSAALILFDEIVRNGFDPHNFLNGLSEHLRNLLVCKDPSTIKLLEVSEGVQERYIEQARNASMSFLLSALNLANQADVNFKSSKNQRLHVELMLMKLCHLQDVLHIGQNGTPEAAEKKKHKSDELVAQSNLQAPAAVAEPVSSATAPMTAVTIEAPKTGNGSSVSLKGLMNRENLKKVATAQKLAPKVAEEADEIAEAFERVNPERFDNAWKAYVSQLDSRGKTSLHYMAETLKPEYTEAGEVVVRTKNDSLANQLEADRNFLTDILQAHSCQGVRITFRAEEISEEESKVPFLTVDREKFKLMAEQNPALYELQEKLGLRID